MTGKLTREEILNGLNRLIELCATNNLAVRVQVVGGGAVVLKYNPNRKPTVDVDCVVLGEEADRELFAKLVVAVAAEFGWADDWMNHKVGIFWPETNDDLGWVPILKAGKSQIEVAGPRMLLAMKLRAGRWFRDLPDVDVLLDVVGVESISAAEELFDEYFPYDVIPRRSMEWLRERFGR